MDAGELKLLKEFVTVCKANPEILHTPPLEFYKEYLER